MYCVGCDKPIVFSVEKMICNCCNDVYEVLSYHCSDCGLGMTLIGAGMDKHPDLKLKTKKRGIGRTN